ncbi:MAG: extracellular solute-binding protein [Candidatus Tectomicrobia bacterium]|nr:extracellular solute-binding protein [Candidatus Tectomicrobia bacterium]
MLRRKRWPTFLPLLLAGCCASAGPLIKASPTPDVQAARRERAVVWYTSLRRETAGKLIAAFREKHPIDVAVSHGSDVALGSQFLRGVREGRAEVDVLQLTDPGLLAGLKRRGLLREADVPSRLKVPPWLQDPEGFWVATHVQTAVLAYRRDRVQEGSPPRSWRDLADPRFRGRLVLPDPAEGGPAFYWAAAMERLLGRDFLEALGKNAAALVSSQEAGERMASGRQAVFAGVSGEEAWRVGRSGQPVETVVPPEGVPAVPAASALPKGAPHPAAGALFLDFLLSPAAQRVLAEEGFYPALPEAGPPAGRTALDRLRLLQLPWEGTARDGEALRQRLRQTLKAGASAGVPAPPPALARAPLRPIPPPSPKALPADPPHPCGRLISRDPGRTPSGA